jgi:O-antigen/teichoic acid export membrane protein
MAHANLSEAQTMKPTMRTAFLVHAAVALVFGLILFLIPSTFASGFKWTPFDPTSSRLFGAASLGLAVSSWLASRAESFAQVKIKLWLEMVYGVLGAVGGLYQLLFADAPAATWAIVLILGGFGGLWIYLYREAGA